MTNVIGELMSDADRIFATTSDTTEIHPVTGLKINSNEIICKQADRCRPVPYLSGHFDQNIIYTGTWGNFAARSEHRKYQ